jgi:hypothetical protein
MFLETSLFPQPARAGLTRVRTFVGPGNKRPARRPHTENRLLDWLAGGPAYRPESEANQQKWSLLNRQRYGIQVPYVKNLIFVGIALSCIVRCIRLTSLDTALVSWA